MTPLPDIASPSRPFANAIFCIALCFGTCAASVVGADELRKGGFEAAFVRQPKPSQMLLADGRAIAEKLGSDGIFPGTVDGPKGALTIENQRRAYYLIAAGVLSEGPDKDELLDKGLKALEWGFDQAGPNGSFPNERSGAERNEHSLYAKSAFLAAAARSLLLLQQVDLEPRYRNRVAALLPRLQHSMSWMAGSRDLEKFFKRARHADHGLTNQQLSIADALQVSGLVTGDASLTQHAQGLIEQILSRQGPDGTFTEKGGFDAKYQTVSLEHLARYVSTLPDSPWRSTVMAALRKGTERFIQTVDETGVIDDSDSTRTAACGSAVAGSAPKGLDRDIVPLRLYYLGYLLDDETRLGALADRIQAIGQKFTKERKCSDTEARTGDKGAKKERRDHQ